MLKTVLVATRHVVITAILLVSLGHIPAVAQDSVEFINGSNAHGKVTEIRKTEKEFDFDTTIGTRKFSRTYPFSKVHAVTLNGKRYVLTQKPKTKPERPGSTTTPQTRTKAEVDAIIAAAGTTPPDWFASTPLNYPKTLDLSWPLKPPTTGWHSQKNMGQYIWSIINENPSRWHSGIKLVHHCMSLHKGNTTLLQRDMSKLGDMYFTLLRDYPRAAFWYEKSNASVTRITGIRRAECYWRIGNKKMALDAMRGQMLNTGAIKLLGDMGEIAMAMQVARVYNQSSPNPHVFVLAGDALRQAGKLNEAIDYYQRIIDTNNFRNKDYETRLKSRAKDSITAIRLFDQADVSKVANGTYRDHSTGYAGQLTIEATVQGGKLVSVRVVNHKEKQFYSALTDTPRQLVAKQSVQGIDGTSGATVTSQAIVNATAKALAQGNR